MLAITGILENILTLRDTMCLFRTDLAHQEWSYIWVDWTYLPQAPRSEVQQTYFQKMLRFIPMLIRDSAFEWRFHSFQPRAWVLLEVAGYIINHTEPFITPDMYNFASHADEMFEAEVRPVVSKYIRIRLHERK